MTWGLMVRYSAVIPKTEIFFRSLAKIYFSEIKEIGKEG
jgi:hypothetical protein